jgi:hypothetical protein
LYYLDASLISLIVRFLAHHTVIQNITQLTFRMALGTIMFINILSGWRYFSSVSDKSLFIDFIGRGK